MACVGCAALAATLLAQTNPKGASRVEVAKRKTTAAASPKLASVKPSERKPLSYYTSGVRVDMFHSQAAPEPVVKPEPPKVEVKTEPEVIDPFVDYAYTGTVMMGDQAVALVENAKTKDGTYVKTGDQLIGGTVTSITDRGITVSIAGKSRTLYKTEDYKLTPLDKSAPYMTPGQGQPGMGGPGMPGMPGMGMPGMGGAMGFPGMQNLPADVQQRIQQRFQSVTPEQMQQMRNRFMNRSFEGGGRRRRFF